MEALRYFKHRLTNQKQQKSKLNKTNLSLDLHQIIAAYLLLKQEGKLVFFVTVFILAKFWGWTYFFQFFVPNIYTSKDAQCTSNLPLNKNVTCDFVFSFTIYKSWKSYFRIFQNVFKCLEISAGFVIANSTP